LSLLSKFDKNIGFITLLANRFIFCQKSYTFAQNFNE